MGRVAARGFSSHAAARYPHSAAIWGHAAASAFPAKPPFHPPPKRGLFGGGRGELRLPGRHRLSMCLLVSASFVSVSTFARNSTLLKHCFGCVKAVQNWLNQRKNRCLVAKSFFVQHSMCCWCSQVFLHYRHILLTHTFLCVSRSLLRCEIGNVNYCLNHVQSVAPVPPAPIASAPPPPSTLAVSLFLFCVRAFACACVCAYLRAGVCMCVCVCVMLAPITIFPPSPSASNAVVSACVRACVRACTRACVCACGVCVRAYFVWVCRQHQQQMHRVHRFQAHHLTQDSYILHNTHTYTHTQTHNLHTHTHHTQTQGLTPIQQEAIRAAQAMQAQAKPSPLFAAAATAAAAAAAASTISVSAVGAGNTYFSRQFVYFPRPHLSGG